MFKVLLRQTFFKLEILAICMLFPVMVSYADIYRNIDENGNMHFTSEPRAKDGTDYKLFLKDSKTKPFKRTQYKADIKKVQSFLLGLGYDPGPIDGILGNQTRKAIKAFQLDIGVPATGRIDQNLLFQLKIAHQSKKTPQKIAGVLMASDSELKKNGFSISLPAGWVEMPTDVIDAFEKEIARLTPNAPAQHYNHAFQLGSSENWFEYPYILVQIKNTGRIPESQLEKLKGYNIQESLEKHKKGLSSILSDVQAGEMVYDKQTKMIWMRIEANVVNTGPISGISGMVLTEKGFIQVMGYCLRGNYPTYENIFQSVALSVSTEPGLAYKPKWSDSLPPAVTGIDWGKVAEKAIAGAIIGGILILIAASRKKKNV